MTSRFTEEEIREAQQYYLKICDGIRAMPGLQDVVAVQETHKEQVTDPRDEVIKVLREGLSFYSDLMPYMAEFKEADGKPFFDFKHTPVHMDGGTKAKQALTAADQILKGGR